jgi:hypothetical protein
MTDRACKHLGHNAVDCHEAGLPFDQFCSHCTSVVRKLRPVRIVRHVGDSDIVAVSGILPYDLAVKCLAAMPDEELSSHDLVSEETGRFVSWVVRA